MPLVLYRHDDPGLGNARALRQECLDEGYRSTLIHRGNARSRGDGGFGGGTEKEDNIWDGNK